ncbi:MAG: RagB/SusD family nutrient uptake outer membrane protein [Muribaculaceae bacterium]|nr:RagB/SusD family nutrient uptake outer membrane protein [Muribaculaceae bacterium]
MKKLFIMAAAAVLTLSSCDYVLDRPQLNTPTDETFWNSEEDARLYANGFYTEYFIGYNSGWTANYTHRQMTYSDDYASSGMQANFPTATTSGAGGSTGTSVLNWSNGQTWTFAQVRKANVFMDRIEMMNEKGVLSEEAYKHWMAVAKFFKSFEYYRLVNSFGDVPYYEKTVQTNELDELYKDRDPRTVVMDHVYDMCKEILANMRTNDGTNVLNRYVAAGFISQWMIFEGAWQKYNENNASLAQKYFQLAVEAGDLVINSGRYAIDKPIREVFGSFNAAGMGSEPLLYRAYSDAQAVRHCIASYSNGEESAPCALNLAFLQSVICNDGKVYQKSSVANAGSFKIKDLAQTRDPRLEALIGTKPNISSATRVYPYKFIDRIGPTFQGTGQMQQHPEYASVTNVNFAPVMRYGEVLLNWIEAKAELGQADQAAIDKSINVLRARPVDEVGQENGAVNTAPLKVADITADFDPDRDPSVDPLLWEIRRERRLELALEYSRLVDIRRWGKLSYMDNRKYPATMLGCEIDFNEELTGNMSSGSTAVVTNVADVLDQSKWTVYNGSNLAQMHGFYVPTNAIPRNAFDENRAYLYPLTPALIESYAEKGYTLSQTKGW